MTRKAPKYFHYFLACAFFDCLVLILFVWFWGLMDYLPYFLIFWVIANFLNYPRLASRRYISYYKLLELTARQLLTFYLLYGLSYAFFKANLALPDFWETLPLVSVIISRLIFVFVLRFYRIKGKGYNRFLIIGDTPVMNQLIDRFLSKKSYGHILEDKQTKLDIDAVESLILKRQLNEIYCSSRSVNQDDIAQLLAFSFAYGVNVHVVSDNSSDNSEEEPYEFVPLEYAELHLENYPLIDPKNLILKRIFDLVFSTIIVLTVLSWVSILLAIIIKLESKGPVFFKQPRAGRNGKYFMCLKFRSMRVSADNKQATKNDPRITKIGRIIRKLSIDELPQFINVLRGEMSVVGPRPHIKDLNDKYDSTINNYNDRILVKPGITGLSQITGHRGETAGNKSMINRIRVDILYLKSWTLYLDLVIIYKTVVDVLLFRSKNAY